MWKRLRTYRDSVEALLCKNDAQTDWTAVASRHLTYLGFFQHERLIHLIVTLAFAFMELACALATLLAPRLLTAALMALFLVPLVPYVVHYYHLENGTQQLYEQYDRIVERMESISKL